jgi:hypothetical protein
MAKLKLTKRLVDWTRFPTHGQRFLRDDEVRGFALRVTPGAKSFVVEKEIHGWVRRFTIGRFGVLTVEKARRLAPVVELIRALPPVVGSWLAGRGDDCRAGYRHRRAAS